MPLWLRTSTRVYRLLLRAYPPQFRRAYGPQMVQVFRDCCRDALVQEGWLGLAGLWLRTLADISVTAAKERASDRHTDHAIVPQVSTVAPLERSRALTSGHSFNRFTKRAKRVLTLATEEAHTLQHDHIGTEHLLLGMIAESNGVAGRVLDDLGVKLPQVGCGACAR